MFTDVIRALQLLREVKVENLTPLEAWVVLGFALKDIIIVLCILAAILIIIRRKK